MRFDELDLEDEILDGLEDMNFHEMTPVQEHTIPVILEGRDIIGCAQTGTGKTAAYTLPLLNKLLIEGNPDNVVKSLIIVPTRELAQQIDQQFQGFSYYASLSTTVVYGGGDGKGWDIQKNGMLNGADVVIATPGRMIAHLQNSGVDLSHVEYLILDEADRMLDMGFSDDIMKIISYMPAERQTIMFSATLPPKIRELAKTILRNPAEVNIAISKPNEAIDQSAYICYERQKLGIIRELFAEPTDSKTIIFSSSKLKVKELAHTLKRMGLDVAAMHSDLEQAQREEVMLNFKNNKVKILVATDIVARGIDIEDIGLVLNYDVPHDPEDYIHRIGRTADAVDVVLGVVRHVVVEYQADVLDVDTARDDVRGDEDFHLVVLEVEHHLLALRLLQVGVHGRNVESHALERMGQLLDLEFRRREDDRLRVGRLGEQLADDAQFLTLVADVGRLVDGFVGFRNGDVDLGGIAQNGLGQFADLRGQRRRKHDRLPFGGHVGDDLHNVVRETHVEHAVGLVENQVFDVRKIDAAVLQVGDHAARSGDHHVGAVQHAVFLDVPALAVATAVDHRRREGRIIGEALELLVDLLRQLARRHDDQRFHHIVGVALDEQFVQQRQRIGRGLSRTGLGAADNVAALQNHRNRVLLHGSHLVEIHILKTVEDFILQVEFIETHKTEIFNS